MRSACFINDDFCDGVKASVNGSAKNPANGFFNSFLFWNFIPSNWLGSPGTINIKNK